MRNRGETRRSVGNSTVEVDYLSAIAPSLVLYVAAHGDEEQ